jgi:hypothetical protein
LRAEGRAPVDLIVFLALAWLAVQKRLLAWGLLSLILLPAALGLYLSRRHGFLAALFLAGAGYLALGRRCNALAIKSGFPPPAYLVGQRRAVRVPAAGPGDSNIFVPGCRAYPSSRSLSLLLICAVMDKWATGLATHLLEIESRYPGRSLRDISELITFAHHFAHLHDNLVWNCLHIVNFSRMVCDLVKYFFFSFSSHNTIAIKTKVPAIDSLLPCGSSLTARFMFWLRDCSDLLHQSEHICVQPVMNDFSPAELVDNHQGYRYLYTRWRDPHPFAFMSGLYGSAQNNFVVLRNHILGHNFILWKGIFHFKDMLDQIFILDIPANERLGFFFAAYGFQA